MVQALRMERSIFHMPFYLLCWLVGGSVEGCLFASPQVAVVHGARTRHVFRFIGFLKISEFITRLSSSPLFPQLCQVMYWHGTWLNQLKASSVDDILYDTLSSYIKFKGVFHLTFFQIKYRM